MEYESNVKNMDSFSTKLIRCLWVPKTCPNIKGQRVKQELKKCLIDLLIGPDISFRNIRFLAHILQFFTVDGVCNISNNYQTPSNIPKH